MAIGILDDRHTSPDEEESKRDLPSWSSESLKLREWIF